MIKRNVIFSIVLVLLSCNTQKFNAVSNDLEANSTIIVDFNEDVKLTDTFILNIKNNSDDNLTIVSPAVAIIEKFEENTWRRVRILYCPCGANCIPPPKEKHLKKGQNHEYKWNLKESWCGEKQENGIPETIEKEPQTGLYRIRVNYVFKGESKKIEKQFEIK